MLIDQTQFTAELEQISTRFAADLKKMRTGRASYDLFENINVEAYGSTMQLNSVANVVIEDATNIKVKVWDKGVITSVEKALKESQIGGSVVIESDFIRVRLSPLTEEIRKERVKELNKMLEDKRVDVRQVRQKFLKKLSEIEYVSEDDKKREEQQIQKLIDDHITKLEEIASKKEEDLMTV